MRSLDRSSPSTQPLTFVETLKILRRLLAQYAQERLRRVLAACQVWHGRVLLASGEVCSQLAVAAAFLPCGLSLGVNFWVTLIANPIMFGSLSTSASFVIQRQLMPLFLILQISCSGFSAAGYRAVMGGRGGNRFVGLTLGVASFFPLSNVLFLFPRLVAVIEQRDQFLRGHRSIAQMTALRNRLFALRVASAFLNLGTFVGQLAFCCTITNRLRHALKAEVEKRPSRKPMASALAKGFLTRGSKTRPATRHAPPEARSSSEVNKAALEVDDLDDDERKALEEVAEKGYYHGRPKTATVEMPKRLTDGASSSVDCMEAGSAGSMSKRAEFDEFQQKWDRFDNASFLKHLESTDA